MMSIKWEMNIKLQSFERVVHILYSWVISLVPKTRRNYSSKLKEQTEFIASRQEIGKCTLQA